MSDLPPGGIRPDFAKNPETWAIVKQAMTPEEWAELMRLCESRCESEAEAHQFHIGIHKLFKAAFARKGICLDLIIEPPKE